MGLHLKAINFLRPFGAGIEVHVFIFVTEFNAIVLMSSMPMFVESKGFFRKRLQIIKGEK